MASPTPNKGMTYPAHGGAVNAWDTPINTNFDQLDQNLGGMYNITVTSTATTATYASSVATLSSTVATATIPTSLAQNLYYYVSGPLTRNLAVSMPAVGSLYFFNNQTSGSFSVSVGPAGGTAVSVPQGLKMPVVTSSGAAVNGADAVQARFYSYNGNPNTNVPGTAATANGGLTDAVWDFTNRQMYIATTTGSSAAVWNPMLSRLVPEGLLTANNSTTSPVLTANTAGAGTLYYTPYLGNWTLLSNGTFTYPYQFSQFTLTLNVAANGIFDVFMWENPTAGVISPVIGTGPSWASGGGSVTPGTCARGTGAGSTALSRLGGILVNTVQVTLTNGANTYTCPAGAGVYLGSIWVDGSANQVTCNRGIGQNRKFGVWNMFNRLPINLIVADPTTSWNYSTNTYRASNNSSANAASAFQGVAEGVITANFSQPGTRNASGPSWYISVGENSMTTAGSMEGWVNVNSGGFSYNVAQTAIAPKLGIWDLYCLERVDGGSITFFGTPGMCMTIMYTG